MIVWRINLDLPRRELLYFALNFMEAIYLTFNYNIILIEKGRILHMLKKKPKDIKIVVKFTQGVEGYAGI